MDLGTQPPVYSLVKQKCFVSAGLRGLDTMDEDTTKEPLCVMCKALGSTSIPPKDKKIKGMCNVQLIVCTSGV